MLSGCQSKGLEDDSESSSFHGVGYGNGRCLKGSRKMDHAVKL